MTEGQTLFANGFILERNWCVDVTALDGPDVHQSFWFAERHASQKDGVNQTKNGCVSTNAERDGKDGSRSEARGLAKLAESKAAIRED